MLGGEYNWIITSELANQSTPKALFTCVLNTNIIIAIQLILKHIFQKTFLKQPKGS